MKIYYSVDKMVTDYNEDSQDWSGAIRSCGIIDTGVLTVKTVEQALATISKNLALPPLEAFADEEGRYTVNQSENGEGFQDDKGKFLADYNVYLEQVVPFSL